jgi:hypothetical protein
MKLFIRVKFRAFGFTFGTVSRWVPLHSVTDKLCGALRDVVNRPSIQPIEWILREKTEALVPEGGEVIFDDSGVYVELHR